MLAFSCRRDLANLSERRKPGDGRCRERSERQRTALGGTRRTMAKRASAARDFGHRLALPTSMSLSATALGESMWPRPLHDSTYLSNIMNRLPASRTGNAVLCAVAHHEAFLLLHLY